jgi:tetratricopeptide (TPR) repeat protein
MVHLSDWLAHWVVDRNRALEAAFEFGKRAVALDNTHSMAQSNLGLVHMFRREFDDAQHCFERALALNPNDSIALGYYAIYLTAVGRVDEAFIKFDQSLRINPLQPDWVDWLKGIALFTARRYDEAISCLRTIKDPINEVRGWLAASYAGAGRLDEARATLEEFLRIAEEDMAVFPGCKIAAWEPYWRGAGAYQNEADFEHLCAALRKAGLED